MKNKINTILIDFKINGTKIFIPFRAICNLTVGYRDTSTPGPDPMLSREFRDPGTGQMLTLDSAGRLSLATEIAQVIAAQAWDPNYTFADLREGKHHQIRMLDGTMHEVDPTKGLTFHLTGTQPPGEFYDEQNITAGAKYWWEVDRNGALSVHASIDPKGPYGCGCNIDITFRKGLLSMMLIQYVEENQRIPYSYTGFIQTGSNSYRRLIPSSSSRSLVALAIQLVNELDPTKLQELRSLLRSGQEIDYVSAIDFNIDLLWAER